MTSSKNGQLSLWSSSYKISGLWRLRKSCPRSDDSTFFGNWEFQPQHDPGNLLDPFWGLKARVTTTRKDKIKKWANSLPYKETDAKFDRKVWTKNQKEISKRKKKENWWAHISYLSLFFTCTQKGTRARFQRYFNRSAASLVLLPGWYFSCTSSLTIFHRSVRFW